MNPSKIWLSSPHMGGSEQKYVQEAFDTNWVAPLGPNVSGLENDLENYRKSALFDKVWTFTKKLFNDKPEAWSVNKLVSLV